MNYSVEFFTTAQSFFYDNDSIGEYSTFDNISINDTQEGKNITISV